MHKLWAFIALFPGADDVPGWDGMLDSGPAAFSAKPANLLQVLSFISLTEVATWMLVQGPMRSAGRMGAVPTDFTQRGIGESVPTGSSAHKGVVSQLCTRTRGSHTGL